MTIRFASQTLAGVILVSLIASSLVAQPETENTQSVVLQAKQLSKLTGRPILAIAGSNT